jgi:signal transduction histidine kinase
MLTSWRTRLWIPVASLLVVTYGLVAYLTPYPRYAYELSLFGNGVQSALLLILSVVLLFNGLSSYGKARYFWTFMSIGTTLWFLATVLWMWFEAVIRQPVPEPFVGDVLFFIHVVPMMGALAIRPHRFNSLRRLDFGSLDLAMLLLWWIYLYCFIVLPWQYVVPNVERYGSSFSVLYLVENVALLLGLAMLSIRVRGPWRSAYLRCLVAAVIYSVGSRAANAAISRNAYYSGSLYDLPLVISMCVFLYMALAARRKNYPPMPDAVPRLEATFVSRIAMLSVLSLPIIGAWGTFAANVPPPVVVFRLKLTALALFALPACVFLKQHLLDRELVRLLGASQRNFGNLKRLQAQLVQSEKLTALGELVAGAAHQISNPLTAIIGYSDLLEMEYPDDNERASWIRKIGQQARRTQDLLKQLLVFAKQEPAEKLLIDLNRVVADAVELRELDLEDENTRIIQRLDPKLPHLWGDSNHLLQVCFHIIGNAVDAMKVVGGGTLTVTTNFEEGTAVVEFADTGTGVADPQRIFDPFYTTKPVGKGAGLGLSAAYGIVTDHGGTIVCHNRPEGGATFTVRFPISYPLNESDESKQTASVVPCD